MTIPASLLHRFLWPMLFVFGGMWGFFSLESVLGFRTGLIPRSFSADTLTGLLTAWASHENKSHIVNNSIVLLILIPALCLCEEKPLRIIIALIGLDDLTTWLFGGSNTLQLGASGLAYACFGYLLISSITLKRPIFLIPLIACIFEPHIQSLIGSLESGLIPQNHISFIGHFGGLIDGLLYGMPLSLWNHILPKHLRIKTHEQRR